MSAYHGKNIGGPLTHPDIEKILVCFRKYFPYSDIDLWTNGLLLTQMKESFFICMAEKDISIHISEYLPVYKNIEKNRKAEKFTEAEYLTALL